MLWIDTGAICFGTLNSKGKVIDEKADDENFTGHVLKKVCNYRATGQYKLTS
jgi:hypothetical protein